METEDFKDQVRQGRGFFPSAPLHTPEAVGDAAIAGANCLFSKFGQIRSWRGFSPANSPGAKLLHVVGGLLAGSKTGNIWKQHGEATFFIGSGGAYLDDFFNPIGGASAQLQVRIGGQTYQAGLPAPTAPGVNIATDPAGLPIGGRVTGKVSAQLTRIRTVTGAESPASDTSAAIVLSNSRLRVRFPVALNSQGQDEWAVYLSRQGFGEEGPHYFYRQVKETEIAPLTTSVIGSLVGSGVLTIFGGTTATPVNSRLAIMDVGGGPGIGVSPKIGGTSFSMTPSLATTIRVQKPNGAQLSRPFMLAQITFRAVHRLTPTPTNKGVATITAVTGVWTATPELNPQAQGIKVIVEQDSQTTFRWKKESDLVFSSSLPLATTPTALGSTGLYVAWSTAASSAAEVGNTFTIEPFSLIPPPGWGLGTSNNIIVPVGNPNGVIGMGVYSREIDGTEGDFFDWTTSAPTLMSSLAIMLWDCTPAISDVATAFTSAPATTHITSQGTTGPPSTRRVVVFLSGDDNSVDFTTIAQQAGNPAIFSLSKVASTVQLAARFLDIDYTDDDLNENILAPKYVEGPPAGTHGFPLGPLTVVAGCLGGTGLAPSRPNQAEQYDLTEATYLNPPEQIVRCEISPKDGTIFIWTRNSLQTVIYTDEDISPIRPQTIWSNAGIANPSGACLGKTGPYAATAERGFARYTGSQEPDLSYADPVDDYVKDWAPEDVAMGYHGILDGVAHCRGQEILFYFEALGIWSPPLRLDLYGLPGDPDLQPRIVSCATIDSQLYFVVQTGEEADENYEIFAFDIGLGGEWFLRGVTRHGGAPGLNKTLSHLRLIADFSTDQLLAYRDFFGVSRRMGTDMLVMNNPAALSYCVGKAALPKYWTTGGRFRLEWTITAPQLGERWVAFTDSANLARFGLSGGPLPSVDQDTNSLFAWRVDPAGVLSWYLAGVATVHASVQVGDVVRIEWDASGNAVGMLLRAGAPVGVAFNFGQPGGGWPQWLGFKVGLDAGGTLSLGRLSFAPLGQSGRLKVWKNFAAERGGAPVFEKTYQADGDRSYDWEKPNLTEIVSYNVEVGGNSADQDVSVVYLEGYTSDVRQSLLSQ